MATITVLAWGLLGAVLQPPAAERVEFTLANGLRVRLVVQPQEKTATVLLGVRAGFFEEAAGVPHLAHVTEHLTVHDLPPGSDEARAVARWFADGKANGETFADFMYFDLHVPADELPLALRVQAGRLKRLPFSRDTLVREVPNTLAEVATVEKSGYTARFALAPLVQSALHQRDDVPLRQLTKAITVEQVRDFHTRLFRPDRAILTVIGAFDAAQVRKQIEADFGTLANPKEPVPPRPALKPGTRTAHWDVNGRQLFLAWPAPAADQADHAALSVAAFLLLTRLFQDAELKPHLQLPPANNIEGVFLVHLALAPQADAAAVKAKVLEHVARLAKADGLGDAEAAFAVRALTEQLKPLDLSKVMLPPNVPRYLALANGEIQRMLLENAWGDLGAYGKRVAAVTAADVRGAVGRLLTPERATVVVVEPKAK
jgi:predicted Zn-dependent peptidase